MWGKIALIFKALSVAGILANDLPAALADGKITVDEMVALIKKLLGVFDLPVEIEVPDDLLGQELRIKEV